MVTDMRRLLVVLILLLFPVAASAAPSDMVKVLGQWNAGGGTPAQTYLLSEDFDGSTACGNGVDSNCSGTWTKVGAEATTDFSYSTAPAPLAGTYSAFVDGSAASGDGWYRSFTAQDTVYFYFIVNPTTRTARTVVSLRDSSGNTVMRVSDSGPEIAIYCNDTLAYSATAFANGTTVHIWADYTKGTGSNASCHLYHSSDSTKPGSPQITASGNATAQAAQFFISKDGSTPSLIFDKIRVSTTAIGSAPE